MKRIVVDPTAQEELEAAAGWYESQKEGLGREFLQSIEEAVYTIQRCPTVFPLFKDTSIRRYAIPRFPYVIFYEDLPNQIWVYAFAHSRREPGYWLGRVTASNPPPARPG